MDWLTAFCYFFVLRIVVPWGAPVRCSGRRFRRVVPQGKAGHRPNAWDDHPSPDGSRERAAWAEGTASMDLSFFGGADRVAVALGGVWCADGSEERRKLYKCAIDHVVVAVG